MPNSLTLNEVCNRLLDAKNPVLFIHAKPDGDCVGSFAALATYFIHRGEQVSLASQDPIPQRLQFLVKDLTLVPFNGEKGDRTFISCDVPSPQQFGEVFKNKYVLTNQLDLMIDHHATGCYLSDYFVMEDLSSTGEVLYHIFEKLMSMGKMDGLTQDLAYPLYAAISSDTGCFKYKCANETTYMVAAKLISLGIPHDKINHLLFNTKSPEQFQAEKLTMNQSRTTFGGKIGYASISLSMRGSIPYEEFESSIDLVRSIAGVEVCFMLKEQENHDIRVSLRSTAVDVSLIAKKHDGGGHVLASGCTFHNQTIEEVEKILIQELQETLR